MLSLLFVLALELIDYIDSLLHPCQPVQVHSTPCKLLTALLKVRPDTAAVVVIVLRLLVRVLN